MADETKELTQHRLEETLEKSRPASQQYSQLERFASAVLEQGFDPEAAGSAYLEGILELSNFDRGFLFVFRPTTALKGGGVEISEVRGLQVLASRARASGQEETEWVSVLNPEFAVNHSVIQRAVGSRQVIVLNDCLVEPVSQEEAQVRAVLCEVFDLCPGVQGILYLDREPGRGDVSSEELHLLRLSCSYCLPAVGRALAVQEIERLRDGSEQPSIDVAEAVEDSSDTDAQETDFYGMKTQDPQLDKIFQIIEKIKDSNLNICIVGESGTGKELLARAIHKASNRNDKMFVAENCGSIAENLLESELFGHVKGAFTGADEDRQGLFQTADGGVLFLDEIGDMSEGMQRKLLRVLEEGAVRPIGGKDTIKVDVRVICASNRDLKELVRKKIFRADLFYRLNVVSLVLPPLRERRGDISLLVRHFANETSRDEGVSKRFSDSAMKAFTEYSWPGNLRELRNVVRRVMLVSTARVIARKDVAGLLVPAGTAPYTGEDMERDETRLVLRLPPRRSFHAIIEECERIVLLNALRECAWNKSKVTQVLKIPRQSLYNKIAKYKLRREWNAEPLEG